tara:strand:+ start:916 stop:1251 length:336 start_codon:yes stop_codon:yes gene_type:complete
MSDNIKKYSKLHQSQWTCRVCRSVIDQTTARIIPISIKTDQTGDSDLILYVCPGCYCVQMPQQMFKDIHKSITGLNYVDTFFPELTIVDKTIDEDNKIDWAAIEKDDGDDT